jgi:DNA-binding IclR family transcriptional regulator
MPLLTSATGRCFAAFMPQDLTTPMIKAELARIQKMKRPDVPATQAEVKTLLSEVRTRGLGRVIDALLPGVVGFCAPVFDSDSHVVLGMVSLGPASSFDASWDGKPAKALRVAAQQLSGELGFVAG